MKRAFLLSILLGACVGEAQYTATGTISTETPDLAYVAPGVQVIADYDEPIFYADGFYWWHYGDGWYRSSYYTGGWAYAEPPRAVLSIGVPTRYVHYRPTHYVVRHRPVPAHRVQRPVVRDHRARR